MSTQTLVRTRIAALAAAGLGLLALLGWFGLSLLQRPEPVRPAPSLALAAPPATMTALDPVAIDRSVAAYRQAHRVVIHALYITAPVVAIKPWFNQLIDLVQTTELNAVVIDVKTDGYVRYDTQDPLLREEGFVQPDITDLAGIVRSLKAKGIYTIARIVTFNDPGLAKAHPDWAIQDARGGIWRDRLGNGWVDPYNPKVWQYNLHIAHEVATMGFNEVQFDYVRFPSDGRINDTRYPDANGRTRVEAIAGFLQAARRVLDETNTTISADIFGLIPSVDNDQGIGQRWPEITASVDYVSPMAYPSHYAPYTFGFPVPDLQPGPTVARTVQDSIANASHFGAFVRPWLQDFSLGHPYGPAQVRAEIDAAQAHGAVGWLLWNAGNQYTPGALKGSADKPVWQTGR